MSDKGRSTAQQPVHRGYENKGRQGREEESADYRSAEGCVLFAALADP
jgi:hypothetical protein